MRTPATPVGSTIDVAGLVVEVILRHAEGAANSEAEAAGVIALRSSLRLIEPTHALARAIYGDLQGIANRGDVTVKEFRDAVDQVLKIAAQAESTGHERWLDFLRLLAD